jgi:hypothetical protein
MAFLKNSNRRYANRFERVNLEEDEKRINFRKLSPYGIPKGRNIWILMAMTLAVVYALTKLGTW